MLALVVLNGSPGLWRTFRSGAPFGSGAEADVVAREVLTSHLRSLADAGSSDGRGVVRSAHGQTVVFRQANRFLAAAVNDFRRRRLPPHRGGRLDYLAVGRSQSAGLPAPQIRRERLRPACCRRLRISAVKSGEHDGYNLLHWRRGGMNYWMASDLSAQEMDTFAGLLRAASATPAPHS